MRQVLGSRKFLLGATGAFVGLNVGYRLVSSVQGEDQFAQHTSTQHTQPARLMSGMHEPFFASLTPEEQAFCDKHFAEYKRLLQLSGESFDRQTAIRTPVNIYPLSKCPLSEQKLKELKKVAGAQTVVVGGAPALLSSAKSTGIVYINDSRQLAVSDSSPYQLEWDSAAQKPRTFEPLPFVGKQLKRIMYPETLGNVEKTGFFSSRSIDWVGWISKPGSWAEGLRVACGLHEQATKGAAELEAADTQCAAMCKANQKFLDELNTDMKSKLYVFGRRGALIYTRNRDEYEEIRAMRKTLLKQGRQMQKLTQYHVDIKYGYEPKNMSLAVEKLYVRIMHPNFIQRVSEYIASRGNTVIDGVVTAVYTDSPEGEGFVEYTLNSGKGGDEDKVLVPYSKLVLSLGNEDILDENNKPLLDSVYSTSVSSLGMVYLKKGRKMPSSLAVGPANRVTNLAGPVRVVRDHKDFDCYLVRLSSGECIRPIIKDSSSSYYDSVAATGLISATRRWLSCDMDVLSVWGCSSRFTKFGQMRWFKVVKNADSPEGGISLKDVGPSRPTEEGRTGIVVQIGAGGAGVVQGPSQGGNSAAK